MKQAIKNLFYAATGGRPMIKGKAAFIDVVTGNDVYYYTDYYGREWLAEEGFYSFRVEASKRG